MPKHSSTNNNDSSPKSIYYSPNVQGEKKMPSFEYTPTNPPQKK